MVQAVLTAAGYIVGSYFGYPELGAIVGSAVGAAVTQPDAPEPPKVNDLKAPQIQYGSKLLRLYGSNRTSGSWLGIRKSGSSRATPEARASPTRRPLTPPRSTSSICSRSIAMSSRSSASGVTAN
jgi:hypothetical protein